MPSITTISVYDLPFNPDFHLRSSKFWQLRDDFKVETSIPIDPSDPSSERIIGRPDFGSSVEQQYKFPDTLFGGRNATGEHSYQEGKVVPLRLDINFKGQTIATVNFDLRQRLLPYSRFSICMKPFYGETVPKAFVECESASFAAAIASPSLPVILHGTGREHHRLLGFEAVHFSSRVANTVIAVEKLNELTGGFDSFESVIFRARCRRSLLTPSDQHAACCADTCPASTLKRKQLSRQKQKKCHSATFRTLGRKSYFTMTVTLRIARRANSSECGISTSSWRPIPPSHVSFATASSSWRTCQLTLLSIFGDSRNRDQRLRARIPVVGMAQMGHLL